MARGRKQRAQQARLHRERQAHRRFADGNPGRVRREDGVVLSEREVARQKEDRG